MSWMCDRRWLQKAEAHSTMAMGLSTIPLGRFSARGKCHGAGAFGLLGINRTGGGEPELEAASGWVLLHCARAIDRLMEAAGGTDTSCLDVLPIHTEHCIELCWAIIQRAFTSYLPTYLGT